MDLEPISKIVFCGSSTVGKTSLFNRLVEDKFEKTTTSTTGAAFASIKYNLNGEEIVLNLWDTAGQEEYRSLVNIYFRETTIVIIMFDLSRKDTFDDADRWLDDVMANCGDPHPDVIVVGNKLDIENRSVMREDAEMFVREINAPYFEVSAKTGEGIDLLLETIARMSHDWFEKRKSKANNNHVEISGHMVKKDQSTPNDKERCC